MKEENILPNHCYHETKKSLQQGIESDHFRVKKVMAKNGYFQSFHTTRKTIKGCEAIFWIKKEWALKENKRSTNKSILFKTSLVSII